MPDHVLQRTANQGILARLMKFLLAALLLVAGSFCPCAYAQQSEMLRKQFLNDKAKAEQGSADAQNNLGGFYYKGLGVEKNYAEAVKWFRKSAEQGDANGQHNLGCCFARGDGVPQNWVEAVKWFRKAAVQGHDGAQNNLGSCYSKGNGAAIDLREAARWYRKAAEQGEPIGQHNLGACYAEGEGVPRDYVEAYKWISLSEAQGYERARTEFPKLMRRMTQNQIAEAQQLARAFKPRQTGEADTPDSRSATKRSDPFASGTGFFITDDGFLMTNAHVVKGGTKLRLVTDAGIIAAKVVKVDSANDLALLKAEGRFAPLPVAASRTVRLGITVATVGFPNIGLQGFAPKLAKGEIAALSGAQDDARYFQISVPIQPGNSGGALVDERGNVVGIVSAKLSAKAALDTSGALPENVNYAVKSSFLLGFLESLPAVAAKLKEPNTKDERFEDAVKSAEQSTVLVLVY